MVGRALQVLLAAELSVITALAAAPASAQTSPGLKVRTSRTTGNVTFVTTDAPEGIPVKARAGMAAPEPDHFLNQHGHLFGVTDPSRQLARGRVSTDKLGHRQTTYKQMHNGVPVFTGVLRVHQDAAGRFRAANGRFFPLPEKLSTTPKLTADQAEAVARKALNRKDVALEKAELTIVDPGWYGDPPIGPHLAWHIVLRSTPAAIREGFFIDAHTGDVLDRWDMIHRARQRVIYNGDGTAALPGQLVRSEGDPPLGSYEIDRAYDYAGDTYDYFYRAFGRDGLDDLGSPMILTVNSTAGYCPNVFWNGQQVVLCHGMVTDDIVAHELVHGLTEHTANLLYQNQSGQLNEAISDIFGELIDLFNGDPAWPSSSSGPDLDEPSGPRSGCSLAPTYPEGYRWLIGEGSSEGPIRDLWSPTCFYNPDVASSIYQDCDPYDNGGVHSGSGIPCHAFAMMTDGKVFNGYTVNGIGPIKAGAVWYRALTTYLSPGSDFEDAYFALNQAAQDLIGTYPNDPRTGLPSAEMFTEQDAIQVDQALLAVEMNGPGRCGATIPILDSTPPDVCGPDFDIIFADDFENGSAGWTVSNTNPPTAYDWVQTTGPLPFGRPGKAWFCADPNIGNCGSANEAAAHALTSPPIQIPSDPLDPTLMFTHYIASEPNYDGGNVKISVNGGPWQLIPASAFTYNPYNATLFSSSGNHPLNGQPAWSGVGGEWGTSVIRLNDFVSGGDVIRLRFEFGKDGCFGVTGWYIDDLVLFTCPASPPVAQGASLRTPMGSPVNIVLPAQDDGRPIPPGRLSYTITSLPVAGRLEEPEVGFITEVPHLLANYGNRVIYVPLDPAAGGPDQFTYEVSDGGEPPEGGSSTATIYIQVGPIEYFTEHFVLGTAKDHFDLANKSLTLRPEQNLNRYSACIEPIISLPVDPTEHTQLIIEDDGSQQVNLTGDNAVVFYEQSYQELFICSNGYIVLDTDPEDPGLIESSESLGRHFTYKQISALFDDLNPAAGGRITFAELPDRAVVTWSDVPKYGTSQLNTFQVEMFFDGVIRISWLDIGSPDALVGLSNGTGIPSEWLETDFSHFRRCQPGDFDQDGDVDLTDFGHLQRCLTGTDVLRTDPTCLNAHMDIDGDIDSTDVELFLQCLSGANQPGDPTCAD